MATNSRSVREFGILHVLLGAVALLGWVAMGLLAVFHELPQGWPETLRRVEDLVFFVTLLGGPAFLAAGIGLLKRRPWARLLTMGLGGVAGVLAVMGFALAWFGVLRASRVGDFALLALFPIYCVGVFVTLWNETPTAENP
jgi:hypothetical protein